MATATAKRESTRDQILDAADRLMARYGFRKTGMDDVAREAGVSKRTIYVYFKSKEDVGLSSIGRVVERVHDELREVAAEPTSVEERLRRMLRRRVLGRVEQVKAYANSLDELFEAVRPAYMARRAEYFRVEKALLKGVLGDAGITGDPGAVAESLMLATNAFLPYSLTLKELGSVKTISVRLDAMIDVLLHGVLPPSAKEEQR